MISRASTSVGCILFVALFGSGCFREPDLENIACSTADCPTGFVCVNPPMGRCVRVTDSGPTADHPGTDASSANLSETGTGDAWTSDRSADASLDTRGEVLDSSGQGGAGGSGGGTGGGVGRADSGGDADGSRPGDVSIVDSSDVPLGGSDGRTETGGRTGAGGTLGTGGTMVLGAGGIVGTGGTIGTGGVVGTGGTIGTGGIVGTGGTIGTGGVVGTGGTIGTGGVVGTGGSGCVKGQTLGRQVITIGDSFFEASSIVQEVETRAKAAGSLASEDQYVRAADSGMPIATIASNYREAAAGGSPKYVIMQGGGIDCMNGNFATNPSGADPILATIAELFDSMASDNVESVVYVFYADPQGSSSATLKSNYDVVRPRIEALCNQRTAPKCYFLDLRPVWEGHYSQYTQDGIHATNAGSVATGSAIWQTMVSNCVAQ